MQVKETGNSGFNRKGLMKRKERWLRKGRGGKKWLSLLSEFKGKSLDPLLSVSLIPAAQRPDDMTFVESESISLITQFIVGCVRACVLVCVSCTLFYDVVLSICLSVYLSIYLFFRCCL